MMIFLTELDLFASHDYSSPPICLGLLSTVSAACGLEALIIFLMYGQTVINSLRHWPRFTSSRGHCVISHHQKENGGCKYDTISCEKDHTRVTFITVYSNNWPVLLFLFISYCANLKDWAESRVCMRGKKHSICRVWCCCGFGHPLGVLVPCG